MPLLRGFFVWILYQQNPLLASQPDWEIELITWGILGLRGAQPRHHIQRRIHFPIALLQDPLLPIIPGTCKTIFRSDWKNIPSGLLQKDQGTYVPGIHWSQPYELVEQSHPAKIVVHAHNWGGDWSRRNAIWLYDSQQKRSNLLERRKNTRILRTRSRWVLLVLLQCKKIPIQNGALVNTFGFVTNLNIKCVQAKLVTYCILYTIKRNSFKKLLTPENYVYFLSLFNSMISFDN